MDLQDFLRLNIKEQVKYISSLPKKEADSFKLEIKRKDKFLMMTINSKIQSAKNLEIHNNVKQTNRVGQLKIPLDDILPHPNQPRKDLREEDILDRALSIQERGLLQPIRVIKIDGKYYLIVGQIRLAAYKLLREMDIKNGIEDSIYLEIAVTLEDKENYNMLDFLLDALTENNSRTDMTLIDTINSNMIAYEEMKKIEPDISIRAFARRIGKESAFSNISKYIKIYEQTEEFKQYIREKDLNALNVVYQIAKRNVGEKEKIELVDLFLEGKIKRSDLEKKDIDLDNIKEKKEKINYYSFNEKTKIKILDANKLFKSINKSDTKESVLEITKKLKKQIEDIENDLNQS